MSDIRLSRDELEDALREARLSCDRAFGEWRDRRGQDAQRDVTDPLVADVRGYVGALDKAAAQVRQAERMLAR